MHTCCFGRTLLALKYAAISDTDSIYMTPVAPEDMFDERGRPVIIGRLLSNKAESNSDVWHSYSMGTKILLKKPEVMKCMTNFPMIFKVEEMIEYIGSVHGKKLIDAVSNLPSELLLVSLV